MADSVPTTLKFYDTAAHRIVSWQPPQHVRMYVCGITPYDSAHLGHILTFMTYDLLQRYLEDLGHGVTMVRNITDVDEPIFAKAQELSVPYMELAARETKSFHEVLHRLHFRPLEHEPRASDYIEEMAASVSKLLAKGVGYYVDKDIYFDTAQDPEFGTFSGFSERLQLGLMAGRGGDPERPGKRNPLDFLLWRAIDDPADPAAWKTAAAPALPYGRPGWHIECTVMSSQLLGTPFDLHGGGNDLIFPHHECEIAQTRFLSAERTDQDSSKLATHWLHTAPLHYCGEKMSKSLGNLVFAKDLLKTHEPSAIRLALMNYHYRIGGEWVPCLVREAEELLARVRAAVSGGFVDDTAAEVFGRNVRAALADDLDTHSIMHLLTDLADSMPTVSRPSAVSTTATASASNRVEQTFRLLGLNLRDEPLSGTDI
jgi:L-cysteine:1D-myo-inositol 2-amino-2-deoxy-alpha-D-glucopyranoside ligase